jgi:hypothetical protein
VRPLHGDRQVRALRRDDRVLLVLSRTLFAAHARIAAHGGRDHDRLSDRELIADATNPLGLDGIEFVEYATSKPQALGQCSRCMGFRPVARHRSREVLLYGKAT